MTNWLEWNVNSVADLVEDANTLLGNGSIWTGPYLTGVDPELDYGTYFKDEGSNIYSDAYLRGSFPNKTFDYYTNNYISYHHNILAYVDRYSFSSLTKKEIDLFYNRLLPTQDHVGIWTVNQTNSFESAKDTFLQSKLQAEWINVTNGHTFPKNGSYPKIASRPGIARDWTIPLGVKYGLGSQEKCNPLCCFGSGYFFGDLDEAYQLGAPRIDSSGNQHTLGYYHADGGSYLPMRFADAGEAYASFTGGGVTSFTGGLFAYYDSFTHDQYSGAGMYSTPNWYHPLQQKFRWKEELTLPDGVLPDPYLAAHWSAPYSNAPSINPPTLGGDDYTMTFRYWDAATVTVNGITGPGWKPSNYSIARHTEWFLADGGTLVSNQVEVPAGWFYKAFHDNADKNAVNLLINLEPGQTMQSNWESYANRIHFYDNHDLADGQPFNDTGYWIGSKRTVQTDGVENTYIPQHVTAARVRLENPHPCVTSERVFEINNPNGSTTTSMSSCQSEYAWVAQSGGSGGSGWGGLSAADCIAIMLTEPGLFSAAHPFEPDPGSSITYHGEPDAGYTWSKGSNNPTDLANGCSAGYSNLYITPSFDDFAVAVGIRPYSSTYREFWSVSGGDCPPKMSVPSGLDQNGNQQYYLNSGGNFIVLGIFNRGYNPNEENDGCDAILDQYFEDVNTVVQNSVENIKSEVV
jgi:hypothetical protein